MNFVIKYSEISEKLKELNSVLSLYKKEHKSKKKNSFLTKGEYIRKKDGVLLIISYYCEEDEIGTASILCPYMSSVEEEKIIETHKEMLNRVDYSFSPYVIDGNVDGIYEKTINSVRPYYYKVEYYGKNVYIPFMRSFFHSMKKLDRFQISIRETIFGCIYLVSMLMEYKGIVEQYVYYLDNVEAESNIV